MVSKSIEKLAGKHLTYKQIARVRNYFAGEKDIPKYPANSLNGSESLLGTLERHWEDEEITVS